MIKIRFTLIFKRLLNDKLYSLVNIFGLTIAITLVLLLSIYIQTEKGVDGFHKNRDRIFRMVHTNGCSFSPPFAQYVVDHISGVESYCRTFETEAVLTFADNKINSPACLFVDTSFFHMFSFPLVSGNPFQVLKEKNSIVVSEGFAKQLFGTQNPMGKKIKFKNRITFIVTGIVKDFVENTHFNKPNVIIPFSALDDVLYQGYLTDFNNRFCLAGLYIMSHKNVDLTDKGSELFQMAKPWYWLFQDNRNNQITFQPLKEVYFHHVKYGYTSGAREGHTSLLQLLTFIGIGISFIALFNYTNLSWAQTTYQNSITGIEKISGANNFWIIIQSLCGTIIISVISLAFAFVLIGLAMPVFNQLTGYHLSSYQILKSSFILKSLLFTIPVILLAGIFPALMLTKITPLSAINKSIGTVKIGFVQQTLVVLQFSISTGLVIAMLFILKQNRFMTTYNLGFNKEETLYINLNSDIKYQKLAFKTELGKIAGVRGVSLCNGMPGVGIWSRMFEYKGKPKSLDVFNVDDDYFNVMGIVLKKPILQKEKSCWINEKAAKELDWSPEETTIQLDENKYKSTFVVNEVLPNMHFHSLYEEPYPTMFTKLNVNGWVDHALIRIDTRDASGVIANIKTVFKKFSNNFPIEYAFLNDKINKAYEREFRTARIVGWFSFFAILISALGIFSLAVFAINKRTKEIGIRKVNGAKVSEMLAMINKDFIKWVTIAFIIACPIAYYAMHQWLQNFAYKTELSWWVFALAGIVAVAVAVLTVSWQSWRAATRNPVESLRYE